MYIGRLAWPTMHGCDGNTYFGDPATTTGSGGGGGGVGDCREWEGRPPPPHRPCLGRGRRVTTVAGGWFVAVARAAPAQTRTAGDAAQPTVPTHALGGGRPPSPAAATRPRHPSAGLQAPTPPPPPPRQWPPPPWPPRVVPPAPAPHQRNFEERGVVGPTGRCRRPTAAAPPPSYHAVPRAVGAGTSSATPPSGPRRPPRRAVPPSGRHPPRRPVAATGAGAGSPAQRRAVACRTPRRPRHCAAGARSAGTPRRPGRVRHGGSPPRGGCGRPAGPAGDAGRARGPAHT